MVWMTWVVRRIRKVVTMGDVPGGAATSESGDADRDVSMLVAYRHDVHKMRGRSHADAAERFRGVRVNEAVPLFADRDAALLSRPAGEPAETVPAHQSPRRLPVLAGEFDALNVADPDAALYELVAVEDAAACHEAWLDAELPAMFNESLHYPFTSLKYHTLLTAALLDNYRDVQPFGELFLAVTRHGEGESPMVVPHRTVLSTSRFSLHVTGEPGEWPAARIGDVPARCFADVWRRLPEVPFDVDGARRWRILDAQLRRIRSWSTALQYIEAFTSAVEKGGSAAAPVGWCA